VLEGIVRFAARCASGTALGLAFICQRLPHCRVLRRRVGEVHQLISYHRCGAERATVLPSIAAPFLSIAAFER